MILKIKGASSSISLREGSSTIPLKKKDKYFQAEIEPRKTYCIREKSNERLSFFQRVILWIVLSILDLFDDSEERAIHILSYGISLDEIYKTYLYIDEEVDVVNIEADSMGFKFENINNSKGYIRYEKAYDDNELKKQLININIINFLSVVFYSLISFIIFYIGAYLNIEYVLALIPITALVYIKYIVCTIKGFVEYNSFKEMELNYVESDYYSEQKTKWIRFRNKTQKDLVVTVKEELGRNKIIKIPKNVSREILVDENTTNISFDSCEETYVQTIKNKLLFFIFVYSNYVFLNRGYLNILEYKNYIYKSKKLKYTFDISLIEKPVFNYNMDEKTKERFWLSKTGENPVSFSREEATYKEYNIWKKYTFALFNVTNIILLFFLLFLKPLGDVIVTLFSILIGINLLAYIILMSKEKY